MSENTQITTTQSAQNTALTTAMNEFFNIDFSAMNATIDKLANRGDLSKVEKKEANDIIDVWNENVVDKLRIEENHIKEFVSALNSAAHNGIPAMIKNQQYIDELEALVEFANLQDKYDELCNLMDQYTAAEAIKSSIGGLDDDLATTEGELIIMKRDYEYNVAEANATIRKIGNKILKVNLELVQGFNANDDVRKIITQLKKKASNMAKMRTKCCDLAQLAKINITIDDPGVRDTLKELINSTK